MSINGFINIDKPLNITSNDVVFKVKKMLYPVFGKVKIGHTGTLDPLASGVLPIALGEATKTVAFQMENTKTYEFSIKFGSETSTDDAEGEIIKTSDFIPTIDEIKQILPRFLGKIEQIPPKYSAIKINGKRAYDLARQGEDFEIKPRENFIHHLDLLEKIDNSEYKFKVTANKGFYVRSIARDIARALNSAGFVSYLRRISNGPFNLENSITLDKLEKILQNTEQSLDVRKFDSDVLLPVSFGLNDILALDITEGQNEKLRNGQWIKADCFENINSDSLYKIISNSKLSAVIKLEDGFLKTVRVFNL
ncbi:MAG: tRNA pseudouridine(55) synthase TruB [Alphaproteobacteria bacterium]|mgnify:CR=1 FL=1|nr:tRNA pseudouridine(55) synthase TruB [Alphaproteobacteria bacterium]